MYRTISIKLTLKNTGLFQPKFGSNMGKPKCWVKNIIKKITVESEILIMNNLPQHLGVSLFQPNLG